MPASIAEVDYITFLEAARKIPGRPHQNTIRRWADRGHRGVVLESWRVGNKRVTTIEAIDRFIAATSEKANPRPSTPVLTTSHQLAESQLDELGVR